MNYSLIKAQCFSPNEWSLILRNKLKKENNSFNVKKSIEKKSKKPHYPEIEIFVLKQQLEKGVKISDLDITTKKVKRNFKSDGLITSREELVGRKTKVRIRRDHPIYTKYLKKNWLIEKDSKVIVENNSGPITIKVDGIALENGDYKDNITELIDKWISMSLETKCDPLNELVKEVWKPLLFFENQGTPEEVPL